MCIWVEVFTSIHGDSHICKDNEHKIVGSIQIMIFNIVHTQTRWVPCDIIDVKPRVFTSILYPKLQLELDDQKQKYIIFPVAIQWSYHSLETYIVVIIKVKNSSRSMHNGKEETNIFPSKAVPWHSFYKIQFNFLLSVW